MRCELHFSTVRNRIMELNVIAAARYIRGQRETRICNKLGFMESSDRSSQGVRKDYTYKLAENICEYNIRAADLDAMRSPALPPWEGKAPDVVITPLPRNKLTYVARALKYQYEIDIHNITVAGDTHVYCDGSVLEDGRAGCGVFVRKHREDGTRDEWGHSFKLSDHVSSTQAELCTIRSALNIVWNGAGDVWLFSDNRGALESLVSDNPTLGNLVIECKAALYRLDHNRHVKFVWVPSHVGIQGNEKADELAKAGARKSSIDIQCCLTIQQIKTKIRNVNVEKERIEVQQRCLTSETLTHYVRVANETQFTYGRYRAPWKDHICTRLRLDYKYYWQRK